MPTTIAHMIGGYTAVEVGGQVPGQTPRARWIWVIGLSVLAANAPDLDFLPGLFLGSATRFHRGPTHSIAAAVLIPMLFALIAGRWSVGWKPVFVATLLAYGSHIGLDLLIPDPMGEGGIPLLWPFSHRVLIYELGWLDVMNGWRSIDVIEFNNSMFRTLLSWQGMRVFIVDAILVAPLLVLVAIRRRMGRPATAATESSVG